MEVRLITDMTSLLIIALGLLAAMVAGQRTRPWCRIKCGVVMPSADVADDGDAWMNMIQSAWQDLTTRKGIADVDMQFVQVHRRTEFTIDRLIEAYMEIGTTNISAMIGPYVVPLATATEYFGIPYFVTSPLNHSFYRPFNMISVSPDPNDIVNIATELARRFGWASIAVVYDSDAGARLIEQLVLLNTIRVRSWKIYENATTYGIRDTMISVRRAEVRNIVLFAQRALSTKVLDGALHLSMLAREYCWVLPNLNLDTGDLRAYMYTQVNFTTFKLVQETFSGGQLIPGDFSEYDYATTMDSLLTLYHGIHLHYRRRGTCHWSGKENILSVLSKIVDTGATGKLTFRKDGIREGYIIDILGLGEANLLKVGFWNSSNPDAAQRLNINLTLVSPQSDDMTMTTPSSLSWKDETLRVAVVSRPPYVQMRKDAASRYGNDRFEGFCVDLLETLSVALGFTYEIYVVTDDSLEERTPRRSWEGLVWQLLHGNASMAMGPLMITSSREEVIDYTKPFKMVGFSVVMRRPSHSESLFYFMDPLSPLLWVVLLGILVLLSITLYVVDHVAPADEGRVRLSAEKCVWFACSSLVLRAADVHPRTISGRILAGALWFFSLMMVSAYTANFAALLTATKLHVPIRSLSDLTGQSKVKYGTVRNSHISAFLETSKIQPFQNMWQYMTKVSSDAMVDTAEQGFKRATSADSNYAFIWDSAEVRQKVNEDCELVEIGQPVYFKSYGIGLPHGAVYRNMLNIVILQLTEDGKLHEMERRWWQDHVCPDPEHPSFTSRSLSIERVAGLFILLGFVIFLALAISLAEYFFKVKRRKRTTKNRKVPEESISAKPLCDGHTSASIQQAQEEPFLAPATYSTLSRASKQTNIF